jgi:hypothetical protein
MTKIANPHPEKIIWQKAGILPNNRPLIWGRYLAWYNRIFLGELFFSPIG